MTAEDQERIGLLAGQAFSPSAPINERDVFAGRTRQIRQVVDAITQPGQCVLIYGERGVGKTSLANVIDDFYLSVANQRIFAPHIACDGDDTFATIWAKVLAEKDRMRPTIDLSPQCVAELDNIIEDAGSDLAPHHIRLICEIIGQTHRFIPIIDEFDLVQDQSAIRLMTDTIKVVSDHTRNTTALFVGVGDTVDDLIKKHESVERSLIQVLMGRMLAQEAEQILLNSTKITGVTFSDNSRRMIIAIAQGLPHYVHVLGLNAVRAAADAAAWVVTEDHVEVAIEQSLSNSGQSLERMYHTATTSPRPENIFREVLLACVFAKTDTLGYFAAADIKEPLSRIMGGAKKYATFTQHLNKFSEPERGEILQRIGVKRRHRFRFRNPLVQPLIVMRGLKDGQISKVDIEGLFYLR